MDLQERKRRSLAWLEDLTEAQKSWIGEVEIEPKQRMTVATVNEKYYRELIDQLTLHRVIDDIQRLVHDMYATPDAIVAADAEALAALIAIRTNCEVVLDHQRNKR